MDNKALELWKRWFKENGNPIFQVDSFSYCFFCSADDYGHELKHEDDCIYLEAKKLVEGEDGSR